MVVKCLVCKASLIVEPWMVPEDGLVCEDCVDLMGIKPPDEEAIPAMKVVEQ